MDQVDEVKQKIDIVDVISAHVELKKAGRNFKGLCPFHSEKTSSFVVSPELQIYKCFGCGESGDAITFLEKFEGMEFFEALKTLADKVGVTLKTANPQNVTEKEKLFKLNLFANRFYHYVLTEHKAGKAALSYLTEKRGLKMDTIKSFSLGFAPKDPTVLPNFLLKKGFSDYEIERAGIAYRKGSSLGDRFWGRVIFPLFDHRDNVVGFAGRLMPDDTRDNVGKYINTPETPLYHKSSVLYGLNFSKRKIQDEKFAVVVEGELDMISLYQAGFKNTVAIKGTALTEQHVKLLSRFTQRLVFALDSDMAGDTAAKRGLKLAQDEGFELLVCDLGEYHDPDEMVRTNKQAFEASLKNAKNVWDFLIGSVFSATDSKTSLGKQRISREVVGILNQIEDKILQAHYVAQVASKLGVPETAVYEELGKVDVVTSRPQEQQVQEVQKTRRELLEEIFLAIAFQFDPTKILTKKNASFVKTPLYKMLLAAYFNYDHKGPFDVSAFSQSLDAELRPGFSQLVLKEVSIEEGDLASAQKECRAVLEQVEALDIKEEMMTITREIVQNEGKDGKMVSKLQTRSKSLAESLTALEEKQRGRLVFEDK